jgi:hypothetical protein
MGGRRDRPWRLASLRSARVLDKKLPHHAPPGAERSSATCRAASSVRRGEPSLRIDSLMLQSQWRSAISAKGTGNKKQLAVVYDKNVRKRVVKPARPRGDQGAGAFLTPHSFEELARLQRVKPLENVNILAGGFPDGENFDEFLDDIYSHRESRPLATSDTKSPRQPAEK